jgi:phosphatidylserine synthase
MTNEIKSKASQAAKSVLPWKKGIAWWIVFFEGIVLLGLGLTMFFARTWTLFLLGWIIALSLVVSGALSVYASLKTEEKNPVKHWTMIHGVIGLAAGVLVVILLLFNVLPKTTAFIMGLGCLAYGGVGLYMFFDKSLISLRRISLISTIFYILIGLLILLHAFGMGTLATLVQLLKMVIISAGVILIFWSLIIRNEDNRQERKSS